MRAPLWSPTSPLVGEKWGADGCSAARCSSWFVLWVLAPHPNTPPCITLLPFVRGVRVAGVCQRGVGSVLVEAGCAGVLVANGCFSAYGASAQPPPFLGTLPLRRRVYGVVALFVLSGCVRRPMGFCCFTGE